MAEITKQAAIQAGCDELTRRIQETPGQFKARDLGTMTVTTCPPVGQPSFRMSEDFRKSDVVAVRSATIQPVIDVLELVGIYPKSSKIQFRFKHHKYHDTVFSTEPKKAFVLFDGLDVYMADIFEENPEIFLRNQSQWVERLGRRVHQEKIDRALSNDNCSHYGSW